MHIAQIVQPVGFVLLHHHVFAMVAKAMDFLPGPPLSGSAASVTGGGAGGGPVAGTVVISIRVARPLLSPPCCPVAVTAGALLEPPWQQKLCQLQRKWKLWDLQGFHTAFTHSLSESLIEHPTKTVVKKRLKHERNCGDPNYRPSCSTYRWEANKKFVQVCIRTLPYGMWAADKLAWPLMKRQ